MNCIELNKKKVYQIIAISSIVMSFVLYAIIPFYTCLPYSVCIITGITGATMIVNEIIFWIGSLMIGRDVALKMRKKFSIMRIVNYMKERMKEGK